MSALIDKTLSLLQMTKTIKRLEKENLTLKKKSEKSDVTIIDLLDEVRPIPAELLLLVN